MVFDINYSLLPWCLLRSNSLVYISIYKSILLHKIAMMKIILTFYYHPKFRSYSRFSIISIMYFIGNSKVRNHELHLVFMHLYSNFYLRPFISFSLTFMILILTLWASYFVELLNLGLIRFKIHLHFCIFGRISLKWCFLLGPHDFDLFY